MREIYQILSKEERLASDRFIESIKSGRIRRIVDPSNREGEPYNEEEGLIRYNEFIKSRVFVELMK
jgi:hypothetical protein